MSLIGAVLKWTGLPAWAMELIVIALVALLMFIGVAWWDHKKVDEGIQIQQHQDQLAIDQLKADAQKATEILQKRATAAELAYATEHANNLTPPPILGPLLVCDDPHGRSRDLPTASTAKPGDEASPASSRLGSPVHPPDSPSSEDRRRLLGAVAALFDDQTAIIREYQAR